MILAILASLVIRLGFFAMAGIERAQNYTEPPQ